MILLLEKRLNIWLMPILKLIPTSTVVLPDVYSVNYRTPKGTRFEPNFLLVAALKENETTQNLLALWLLHNVHKYLSVDILKPKLMCSKNCIAEDACEFLILFDVNLDEGERPLSRDLMKL